MLLRSISVVYEKKSSFFLIRCDHLVGSALPSTNIIQIFLFFNWNRAVRIGMERINKLSETTSN